MNLLQIIKLAKTLQKFAEVETNNGILICNGDLAEGVEVFVDQDGEVAPAPDGEYETEDKVIVVAEGKVEAIKEKEEAPAEEPAEEPVEEKAEEEAPAEEEVVEDEKDKLIEELKAKNAELEAKIAELEAQLGKAEEQLSQPVKTETKMSKQTNIKTYIR